MKALSHAARVGNGNIVPLRWSQAMFRMILREGFIRMHECNDAHPGAWRNKKGTREFCKRLVLQELPAIEMKLGN